MSIPIRYRYDTFELKYQTFDTYTIVSKGSGITYKYELNISHNSDAQKGALVARNGPWIKAQKTSGLLKEAGYVLQPRAGSMNPEAIKSLKISRQKQQKRLVSSLINRESEWGLVRGWGRHILYKLVADSVMCSVTPETSKWSCEETRKFYP